MSVEFSGQEKEPSIEWKEVIEAGIKEIEFNPMVLVASDDPKYQKHFDDLSTQEQRFIRTVVYRELNFDPKMAELVDSQVVDTPNAKKTGLRREAVFKTDRSEDEDLYVHIITFEETQEVDGLFIAPRDFVL